MQAPTTAISIRDTFRFWTHPVVGSGQRLVLEGTQPRGLRLLDGGTLETDTVVVTCRPSQPRESERVEPRQPLHELGLTLLGVTTGDASNR